MSSESDKKFDEGLARWDKNRRRERSLYYAFLLQRSPAIQRYVRWHIWDIRVQYYLHHKQWNNLASRIYDIAMTARQWLPMPSLSFYMYIPNGGTATRVCYTFEHDYDGHCAYQNSLKNL
jgi:hypothetical protein